MKIHHSGKSAQKFLSLSFVRSWLTICLHTGILLSGFLFFYACSSTQTVVKRLPTGLEIEKKSEAHILFHATARASQASIDKESNAMKQTTSKDAAMLMIRAELQKKEYDGKRQLLDIVNVDFLEDNEYCKITAEIKLPTKNKDNKNIKKEEKKPVSTTEKKEEPVQTGSTPVKGPDMKIPEQKVPEQKNIEEKFPDQNLPRK